MDSSPVAFERAFLLMQRCPDGAPAGNPSALSDIVEHDGLTRQRPLFRIMLQGTLA